MRKRTDNASMSWSYHKGDSVVEEQLEMIVKHDLFIVFNYMQMKEIHSCFETISALESLCGTRKCSFLSFSLRNSF